MFGDIPSREKAISNRYWQTSIVCISNFFNTERIKYDHFRSLLNLFTVERKYKKYHSIIPGHIFI